MEIYYIYDKSKIDCLFEGTREQLHDNFGITISEKGLDKELLKKIFSSEEVNFEIFDIPKEHEDYYNNIEKYNNDGIYYGYDKYKKRQKYIDSLDIDKLNSMNINELISLEIDVEKLEKEEGLNVFSEIDDEFKKLNKDTWIKSTQKLIGKPSEELLLKGFKGFHDRSPFKVYVDLRLSGKKILFNEINKMKL